MFARLIDEQARELLGSSGWMIRPPNRLGKAPTVGSSALEAGTLR
jgi:hypothetical protein